MSVNQFHRQLQVQHFSLIICPFSYSAPSIIPHIYQEFSHVSANVQGQL